MTAGGESTVIFTNLEIQTKLNDHQNTTINLTYILTFILTYLLTYLLVNLPQHISAGKESDINSLMFDLANFMWHLVWHLLWNCFFWGALSLYSVLFKSTLKNANMQRNWLHGFRSLNCRGWIKGALGARCLGVCNHVGELPKHIPRLFPQKGILLQSQLQTRMTVTNIRSIILWKLWKRKRISLWSNESIPRPGSPFQQKVLARLSLRLSLH